MCRICWGNLNGMGSLHGGMERCPRIVNDPEIDDVSSGLEEHYKGLEERRGLEERK